MKRVLAGIAAVAVVSLVMVVGVRGESASAFCASSIDPKCSPQNAAMLIGGGVLKLGGTTAAVPVAAGSVAATSTAGVSASSIAYGGLAGSVFIGVIGIIGNFVHAAGFGLDGIFDQKVKTDPAFNSGKVDNCTPNTTVLLALSASTYCPTMNIKSSTGQLGLLLDSSVVHTSPTTGTFSLLVYRLATTTGSYDLNVSASCRSTTTGAQVIPIGVRTTGNLNGATLANQTIGGSGYSLSGYNWSCPAGSVTAGVIASAYLGTGTSTREYTNLYNPNWGTPQPKPVTGIVRTAMDCKRNSTGEILHKLEIRPVSFLPGEDVPIPDVACPVGYFAMSVTVEFQKTGTTPWVVIVAPTLTPEFLMNLPVEYPLCYGDTPVDCPVTLWKVSGSQFEFCGNIGQLCPDWAKAPDPATQYRCQVGTYVVDISVCSMYRAPDVGVLPNTNPDGTPIPVTAPVPTTGLDTLTNPDGTPAPGNALDVLLGDGQSPDIEDQQAACFPTGWGALNPVSWVVLPVQCALKWAFVPNQARLQAKFDALKARWQASSPYRLVAALMPVFLIDVGAFESGCEGLAVDMSWIPYAGVGTYYFLPACPGDFFAPWAPMFKTFMVGGITITAALGLTRRVGNVFGYSGADA